MLFLEGLGHDDYQRQLRYLLSSVSEPRLQPWRRLA